jgi:plasmid replication initiation protein
MEHPFFTLSTRPDFRVVEYCREGVAITLTPHATLGLPTMMDKDILLYCGSLVMAEINQGRIPPKTLRFSARDLMVTTNRQTNDVGYRMLDRAFKRLTGALMSTNIKTHDIEESRNFHILDSSRVIKSSRDGKRMVQVEVTLSDWFYRALIGKEVLTINRAYFRLRKTLERRLYELARKHCGYQEKWSGWRI